MAENKTIQLDVETNLGSLRTQLKKAQAEVAILSEKFGATSTEAANAARKAAELKDRIQDAKALTDAFNPDAKFNALSTSIGGVLNGFQAFEGALGVMGVESEDLQKTLLKVQSAMALSQGLQGVMEAKDSFIQLGSVVKNSFAAMTTAGRAFALTGIGLIVTAIGGLIYAYQTMSDEAEQAAQAQKILDNNIKKTNESIENQKENIDALNNITDLQTRRIIAQAKKRGASEEELTQITIQAKKDRLDSLKDEVEVAKKLYLQKSKYGTTEEYEASRKAFLDIQKTYDELQVSLEEDLAEQAVKRREKRNDALLQKEKDFNEYYSNLKSKKVLTDDEIEAIFTQQLIEEDNKRAESSKALQEQKKQDEEDYQKFWWQQYWDFSKAQDQRDEEQKQKDKQKFTDRVNLALKYAQTFGNVMGSLNGLLNTQDEERLKHVKRGSKEEEEIKRKMFERDKKLRIVQTIIDTASNVVQSVRNGGGIPTGIPFGIAAATMGAMQIAAISKTTFSSGNDNPSLSSNVPSANSASLTPSFNITGGNQTTQLLQGLQAQPIKAYVVSSDITSAQLLDQKAIKTSVL